LPPLPAPADNAAMEAEPSKADPPKRKRRWFQFSLRTLLIGVTLLAVVCGYVGWEAKIVRDRKTWLKEHPRERDPIYKSDSDMVLSLGDKNKSPNAIRRWLGDTSTPYIIIPHSPDLRGRRTDGEAIISGSPDSRDVARTCIVNAALGHCPKSSRLAAKALVESTGPPRIEPTLTTAAGQPQGPRRNRTTDATAIANQSGGRAAGWGPVVYGGVMVALLAAGVVPRIIVRRTRASDLAVIERVCRVRSWEMK
jgi:hypothetical protein